MVVFLENDFNPFADLQAADRAHRLGQEKVVNVFNLVTRRSVEEKIMLMQKKKVAFSEAIVNTENSTLYSMGTDRLLDIFVARSAASGSDHVPADIDALAEQICQEYESLSVNTFLSDLNKG
jgi:TATA-binding protein-associated factor